MDRLTRLLPYPGFTFPGAGEAGAAIGKRLSPAEMGRPRVWPGETQAERDAARMRAKRARLRAVS